MYVAAWLAELRLTTTESGRGKKDAEQYQQRPGRGAAVTRIWYGPALLAELGMNTAGQGRRMHRIPPREKDLTKQRPKLGRKRGEN